MTEFLRADNRATLVAAFRYAIEVAQERPAQSPAATEEFARGFFQTWFAGAGPAKEWGHSYFFLFRKNLTITNIQFAELVALVRDNCRSAGDTRPRGLLFRSTEDYQALLCDIKEHLDKISEPGKQPGDDLIDHIVDNYGPLLEKTLIFDMFYGSAAVMLPPGLTLLLGRLCGLAGYVHSCGTSIYVRKTTKAEAFEFISAVERHVAARPDGEILFIPYSHEDFSPYDSADHDHLRHGLDGLKIRLERFYMGSATLIDVIANLAKQIPRLQFLRPGDFRSQYPWAGSEDARFRGRTVWLVSDTSVRMDSRPRRGHDRFYVCYEQEFKNESEFGGSEEIIPAWVSPTTTPAALAAAMINISKPWDRADGKCLRLIDPFVGVGTIWLEALKHDELEAHGSDINPMTKLLLEDNLRFYSMSEHELKTLNSDLEQLERVVTTKARPRTAIDAAYQWANAYFGPVDDIPSEPSAPLLEELSTSRERRFVYYLFLRVQWVSGRAVRRGSVTWSDGLMRELRRVSGYVAKLDAQQIYRQDSRTDEGRLATYRGVCSLVSGPNRKALGPMLGDGGATVRSGVDVSDLPARHYDLIVADPPYGFNKDAERQQQADMYVRALRSMIRALRDNGHLILCLADKSHTGRWLPFFTNRLLISQQVLAIAESENRHAFMESRVLPRTGAPGFFWPPYYWESEGSLSRAVVHFRFKDAAHADPSSP